MDSDKDTRDWLKIVGKAAKSALETTPVIGLMVGIPPVEEIASVIRKILFEAITPPGHAAVREKLATAVTALREAGVYMTQLEADIETQQQQLEEVTAAYNHYQQLAGVEKNKADAFIQEMAVRINQGVVRERTWAFAINIAAGIIVFVLGVVLSDKIKHLFSIQ